VESPEPGKIGYAETCVAVANATGQVSLGPGPVLMTYQENSGTHLQCTYGPGALWLYDAGNATGPTVIRPQRVARSKSCGSQASRDR
jgi:hypothetical protein